MRRVFIPTVVALLCSMVLGATVFREQVAQAAQAILPVFVTNTASDPVPVLQQGTADVNVTGVVATKAALPDQRFSVTHFTTSPTPALVGIDCVADLPAGTRWVISSFAITNDSSTISGLFRLVLLDHTNNQIDSAGPAIRSNPGETVQLTYPQPYVFTAFGPSLCLAAHAATDVYVSVVGYRE